MQQIGPDYKCVGQGDGTFLCDKLTLTAVDIAWLGCTGVIALALIVLVVLDVRNGRVRRARNRRADVHSVSGPRE